MTSAPVERECLETPPKPTYLVVADELAARIARWPAGTRVPSEPELSESAGINRLTARAALQELERRHLVRRRQGAGTFVARRIDYHITADLAPSWTASVRAQGAVPTIHTEKLERLPARPPVAAALGIPEGAPVWALSRLRYVDDELAACADSYLPEDLLPELPARLPTGGSLFGVLDAHYGLEPVRGWTRLGLDVAPEDVARRLRLRGLPQLIAVGSRTDSCRDGRPVDLTHSWFRPEIFRVSVELGTMPPVC